MAVCQRQGQQRQHAIGLDLAQALDQPPGLARPQAAVVQQDAPEAVGVHREVHPHRRGAARDQAAGHVVGLEQVGERVRIAFGRVLGLQLQVHADQQPAGQVFEPVARHLGDDRRGERHRRGIEAGRSGVLEEGVARELGVPLPLELKRAEIDHHMGVLRARGGRPIGLAQTSHLGPVLGRRGLAGQQGEMAGALRRRQAGERPGVDLADQLVAQRVIAQSVSHGPLSHGPLPRF